MVGAGAGAVANVLAVTIAARWFTAHRGLVTGIMLSATASGQLLFLPLLATISQTAGWRMVSITVAVAAFVLLPLVFLLMRDRPQDIGLLPLGDTEPSNGRGAEQGEPGAPGAGGASPRACARATTCCWRPASSSAARRPTG